MKLSLLIPVSNVRYHVESSFYTKNCFTAVHIWFHTWHTSSTDQPDQRSASISPAIASFTHKCTHTQYTHNTHSTAMNTCFVQRNSQLQFRVYIVLLFGVIRIVYALGFVNSIWRPAWRTRCPSQHLLLVDCFCIFLYWTVGVKENLDIVHYLFNSLNFRDLIDQCEKFGVTSSFASTSKCKILCAVWDLTQADTHWSTIYGLSTSTILNQR
jgi:hypothetical protein